MVVRATQQYTEVLADGQGLVRTSQQYAEVLVDGIGDARITNQYVEVLFERGDDNVGDSLTLTDVATAKVVRHVSVGDTLTLSDTAVQRFVFATAETTLSFSDAIVRSGTWRANVVQSLSFDDTEDARRSIAHESVAHEFTLTQKAGRVFTESVVTTLSFGQSGDRISHPETIFELIQTAFGYKGSIASSSLSFTDLASHKGIFRRAVGSTLNLTQSVTFYLVQSCGNVTYHPFVGATSEVGYTPPSTTAPVLSDGTLTLTYPYVSPTSTLVLRNPEYGNQDRLNFNRVNRETRGGTLVVFADPNWPKSQIITVQIDRLKQTQVNELFEFLGDSLGKQIGLLDWEGRQWQGVILTPDATVTHVSRTDRSVSFDFRGQLV